MLKAMHLELEQRVGYLKGESIQTIYFGGGTPSLLSPAEIDSFIDSCYELFEVKPDAEITLEANPDDLNREKITELAATGVNRLSIGVQSFHEKDLRMINRAHTSVEAIETIKAAQEAGLSNITIDLIYGIPGQSKAEWEQNLKQTFELDVQHFSAYALTVEPRTALEANIRKGITPDVDEEQVAAHFHILQEKAVAFGYEPYEISNYARPGFRSRHNSAYWRNEKYLGIGPSAHSFDVRSRSWNIANNALYIRNLTEGKPFYETEQLNVFQQFNEYLMTRLRTKEGIDLEQISSMFGAGFTRALAPVIEKFRASGHLVHEGARVYLTTEGKLLSDTIISEMFVTDEDDN